MVWCSHPAWRAPAADRRPCRFRGLFWKFARVGAPLPAGRTSSQGTLRASPARAGERLSPWVALGCFAMGTSVLFF